MKKKITLGLVMVLVLLCGICIGATVGATAQKQVIQATIDPSVKITVDGEEKSFFDANGSRVFPILYKGTTYLPLRDVCEKVAGFQVNWDQTTRSTNISTRGGADGVDLLDTQKAYYLSYDINGNRNALQRMTSDNKTTTVNGYTLTHWLEFVGDHPFIPPISVKASFNAEGKYDTMTFRYYADRDATLKVFGDNGTVLWEKELKGGELYQEATVDLLKTNQLTFEYIFKLSNESKGFIYDVRLK